MRIEDKAQRPVSRRSIFEAAGLFLVAAALQACGIKPSTQQPTEQPETTEGVQISKQLGTKVLEPDATTGVPGTAAATETQHAPTTKLTGEGDSTESSNEPTNKPEVQQSPTPDLEKRLQNVQVLPIISPDAKEINGISTFELARGQLEDPASGEFITGGHAAWKLFMYTYLWSSEHFSGGIELLTDEQLLEQLKQVIRAGDGKINDMDPFKSPKVVLEEWALPLDTSLEVAYYGPDNNPASAYKIEVDEDGRVIVHITGFFDDEDRQNAHAHVNNAFITALREKIGSSGNRSKYKQIDSVGSDLAFCSWNAKLTLQNFCECT